MSVMSQITALWSSVDGTTFTVGESTLTAQAYLDPGANPRLPAILFGLPTLTYEAYNDEPTEFVLTIYLVVKSDGYVMLSMEPFATAVAAAIYDNTTDIVVTQAIPGVVQVGGTELPAYVMTVEAN
jgi:hypothetical protein